MNSALQGRWNWWGQTDMVDQSKADEFADYLGFSEYAARIPLANSEVYITCDGVGTKLYVANFFNKWDTIGIDLVAMCVNDLLACGATPRAFMDYYAVEKLELDKSKKIMKGILKGCELAGCKLVGGETAQLQGMFCNSESFDLCGFAIGDVPQRTRIHSKLQTPQSGDYLVGIPSSGFHSNGFTQLRDGFDKLEKWMLTPTRIYTNEILGNLSKIKKAAHVTGGGINRAIKRLGIEVDNWAWLEGHMHDMKVPGIGLADAMDIFNCGWGMILVTDTLDLDIEDAQHIGVVL